MILKQAKRLGTLLGLPGIDGSVAFAALAGLFRPEKAVLLAVLFMAGPAAILTATLLEGPAKERMFAALLAGVVATVIVIFAAGLGPELLKFVEIGILKVFGGLAIMSVGLMVIGFSIPSKLPGALIVLGIVISLVIKIP
jgi:hypothetical protein